MAVFNEGYRNIKVKLLSWEGDNLAKRTYQFGRFSNDYNYILQDEYNQNSNDCKKLIDKIIEGTTLPKFAMMGTRMEFEIQGISRICLAQITRDNAIFASGSGGVFPLTNEINLPLSVIQNKDAFERIKKAQELLEEAQLILHEAGVPVLESRYAGLHSQVINVTASYTPADFVRSCFSRTSSNFCDECNYVYRLMYKELVDAIDSLTDTNSIKLWNWLISEGKCINDGFYNRERLYNSDFTKSSEYPHKLPAINDWRKSGWKKELERMFFNRSGYLTENEKSMISEWMLKELNGKELFSTFEPDGPDSATSVVKNMDWYKGAYERVHGK